MLRMAVKHSGLETRWRKLPHNGQGYENNNYLVREQVKPGRRQGFQPWIYRTAPYWTVGLLVVLCYCISLYGDLVHDDVFAIKGNQDIRGSTPWIKLLQNDFWGKSMADNTSHKSYRPLTVLTFRLNYAIHGLSPYGYHVTNVALHAMTSLLLLYMCRHLVFVGRELPAFTATILFVVHPIHTEAVAGTVGRADILSCFLVLLTFITYVRYVCGSDNKETFPRTRSWCLLTVTMVTSTAAMLSKETGITVLGVCFLYDVIIISRSGFIRCIKTRCFKDFLVSDTLIRVLILLSTTVVLVVFRLWVMNGEVPTFSDQDNPASYSNHTLTRVLSYGYISAYNVWLLLCPSVLSYDWQMNSIPLLESLLDFRNAATVGLFVFIAVMVYKAALAEQSSDRRILCTSLLFLVLPFLPASNMFFRVGFVVAERILYIPSVGFCLLVAHGVDKLSYKYKRKTTFLHVCFTSLLILLAARTVTRNQVWASRKSLFLSGLQNLPHNAKMHYNYANLMKDKGENKRAIHHYRRTLELWPNHASASNNLGTLISNDTEAEELYKAALKISHNRHAGAYFNLGNMYHHQGRKEESVAALEAAISLDPACPDVAASLAVMKENQGDLSGAERLLQELVQSQGDGDSLRRYAAFLYRTGEFQRSYKWYSEAFMKNPNDHEALLEGARAVRSLGDVDKASELINRAVAVDKSVETLDTAGVFYFNVGNIEAAIAIFTKANQIDPNNVKTKIHLAQALASAGRFEEALKQLQECLKLDSENMEAMLHITKIYGAIDKHQQALEMLHNSLDSVTDESVKGEIWFEIGNHLKDTNDYKKALPAFIKAVEYDSNLAEAHLNIGVLYHMENNYTLARHHYDMAYKLDPRNEVLRINIKKLNRTMRNLEKNNKKR